MKLARPSVQDAASLSEKPGGPTLRPSRSLRGRLSRLLGTAVACFVLGTGLASPVRAQNLYGEDFARRLASPAEIREATNIRAKLRKESKEGEALFVLTPQPFADIDVAPDTRPTTSRPKQWYLPPWESIDPALPADMPEHIRLEYEARRKETAPADVWSDIEVAGQDLDKPSVLMRPKQVAVGEEFVFRVKEIPPPFSLRRYFDSDKDVFVELAAYGGTTSYRAEEAYRAMKETATKQEPIEGIGESAFLTRVVVVDEATKPASEESSPFDGPAMPTIPPFPELMPEDKARPELTDSGSAAALEAPAFTELAVADLEGKKVTYPTGPKKYVPKGGQVRQTLLVLVAFFPDEAVTITFAVEERLGNVQDLVQLAILAQRNLREEIVARD